MRKIDLLKAMKTFVLVAKYKSFTEAARELNIVTSAVSKQVVELEAHFSIQLLYRTTRTMHLTGEGEFYLGQFKEIISRLEDLEGIAGERQEVYSGKITISAPLSSTNLGYLDVASQFVKSYPDVKLSWLFLNRYVNMVEEGVDLSIRIGHLSDSNMIARQYSTVSVNFVAGKKYLQEYGLPLHPRELVDHRCLLDSSNREPGRWRFKEDNNEHKVVVSPFMTANEGETVAKMAAQDHGIGYLPSYLTHEFIESGN